MVLIQNESCDLRDGVLELGEIKEEKGGDGRKEGGREAEKYCM